MTAPSKLRAARQAPDARARIKRMAAVMREHEAGPEEGCTFRHLTAAGFTEAEIEAYRDDARALLSGRPRIALAPPDGRREGERLVKAARAIRRRIARATARRQAVG